jgi:predicted adenylyl cyclase CyaB
METALRGPSARCRKSKRHLCGSVCPGTIIQEKPMPRNVEIKARVADPDALAAAALALADGPPTRIRQHDTFYRVPAGRLKLRDFGDGRGELIAYQRPDRTGPKTSHYVIAPTNAPAALHEALSAALGVRGVVAKERTLLMCGRTRIHLDAVADLGHFMELEVVLTDDESEAAGLAEAEELMAALGIGTDDLVRAAYIDLVAGSQR